MARHLWLLLLVNTVLVCSIPPSTTPYLRPDQCHNNTAECPPGHRCEWTFDPIMQGGAMYFHHYWACLELVGNSGTPLGKPATIAARSVAARQTGEPLIQQPIAFDSVSAPTPSPAPRHVTPGEFKVAGNSGVPAMHAALLPNGNVVFLDKIEDYSELKLPNGQLAYSCEFDPVTKKVIPLSVSSNPFCCGGAFLADARLITVGGNGPLDIDPTVEDGFNGIRFLKEDSNGAQTGWTEPGNKLASKRWYASAQILADGSIFVASGSINGLDPMKSENNNPTYEILNRDGVSNGESVRMDILVKNQPYFMYPFLHLLNDGNLFVFTSRSSQVFNVAKTEVIASLPDLPGLHRTYPNTGGSVLLPLTSKDGYEPEVMICGGGAFQDLPSPTDASCGRIKPLEDNPKWNVDSMPEGRGMVEGTLLPDGTVLWLNGALQGAQGFGLARQPALEALIFDPSRASWTTAGKSTIARLYHSVALLLLDGTVLVAGSNPNEMPLLVKDINPKMAAKAFPTEFRVEIYTPPYLVGENAKKRPTDVWISKKQLKVDGSQFTVKFSAVKGAKQVEVVLYHGGFVTHSLHMGQRMVVLDHDGWTSGGGKQVLDVTMPEKQYGNKVLPPGPYVVFVVVDGVPSKGQSVMVE